MKERRVFFSELERLAIRDGSKAMFRRAVNSQPPTP